MLKWTTPVRKGLGMNCMRRILVGDSEKWRDSSSRRRSSQQSYKLLPILPILPVRLAAADPDHPAGGWP
jgi:hypothetical protein